MKKSALSLITLASAVVGMTGLSLAGNVGEKPVQPSYGKPNEIDLISAPAKCPLTLSLAAGYSTNYISRGLVPNNALTNHVVPLEIMGEYALNKTYSLVGKIGYQWLTQNSFDHTRYGNLSDEGSAFFGARSEWLKGLKTTLGYQFVNGGLPGELRSLADISVPQSGRIWFHSTQPEEHSVLFNAHYDLGEVGWKNWFVESQVQYVFQWMSGWWFENTLGYKYDVCSRCSLIFSGTWNASAGFFDGNSLNNNGTQGVSLKVEAPIKVTRHFNVAPFISTAWLGDGGLAANRHAGEEIYRNFTVLGGVRLSYTF